MTGSCRASIQALYRRRAEDLQGMEEGLGHNGEQAARGAAQQGAQRVEPAAAHDEAPAAPVPLPAGDRL